MGAVNKLKERVAAEDFWEMTFEERPDGREGQ